jgi:small subunit ribosomal protein S24e
LTIEVNTLQDLHNSLLNRREITAILRDAAGKITRIDAANHIADKLNVDNKKVITISMIGQRGTPDLKSTFYIYNNEQEMNQLPRFRVLRNMPKADRKKLLDEEKAQKLKAKQSSVAKSGSGASKGKR